jgi:hypothetical protein
MSSIEEARRAAVQLAQQQLTQAHVECPPWLATELVSLIIDEYERVRALPFRR